VSAPGTRIYMSTEHSGPAMQNRAQHFQMQPGEPTLATLEETLSGCADNISHLHGWRRHLLGLGGPATVAEDGQRIQRADGRIEVSLRNVQINRGLFNVAVTQQHLNGSQVCTVFQQVCGEAMAQGVFVMLMILVPQESAIAIIRSMKLRSNSFAIFGEILLRY